MKIKFLIFLLLTAFISFGCSPDSKSPAQRPSSSTPSAPAPKKESDTLKDAIQYGKNGQFRYIFAFKRLDDKVMTPDDKEYLKQNSPVQVNYFLQAENGLYAIACSNFAFEEKHFDALKKRFKIEDHSEKK